MNTTLEQALFSQCLLLMCPLLMRRLLIHRPLMLVISLFVSLVAFSLAFSSPAYAADSSLTCMRAYTPTCALDTVVLSDEAKKNKNSSTPSFLYVTTAMKIGRGSECSNYSFVFEYLDSASNSWQFVQQYDQACTIDTKHADPCVCSCHVELPNGLPEAFSLAIPPGSTHSLRVLVTKDKNLPSICATSVKLGF